MITFAWLWSFLLVLPLAAAAWRMLRRGRRTGIRFSAISRLPVKTNGFRAKLAALAPWFFLAGAALLVIACARPRKPLARENRRVDAIAIAMTVDVSGSMEALDFTPQSVLRAGDESKFRTRLRVVKEMFGRFVAARPDDLIGLVTFGGYASARMPLTADHDALLHVLNGVEVPSMSFDAQGQVVDADETMTAIGDGLAVALARLKNAEVKSKIVILLSDGMSNTGAVTPEEAAATAAKMGVKVYVIGVGTRARQTPFIGKDMFGRRSIQMANTSFDETQLKTIAKKTDGRYFAVNDAEGLEAALNEIDQLEKTTLDRTVFQRYQEYFPPFLYAGVACVFLALFLKGLIRSTNRILPVQKFLLFFAFILLAVAAARPRWGHSMQKVESQSRNVVVALDVSRSMLAEDVRPNRLERAKADISDLVSSLEGDRCALVAFRNKGVLLCPLTTDRGFLRGALEGASPESAPRGETDLGAAVRASLDALDAAQDEHNAVILISDGGDLRGKALEMAALAAKRGVPVFTVGLGDPKREATIPDPSGKGVQMFKGAAVKTRLEEKALAEIARVSGGRYVPLATAGTAETTLGAIYRRFLRQVAAKEQAEEEELRATERFGVFLLPGLGLLLAAGMLSKGRFAARKGKRKNV